MSDTEDEDVCMYDEQARANIAALTKRMDTLEKSLETSLKDTLQENLNRVRENVEKGTMQTKKEVLENMKKDVDTFITGARKEVDTFITRARKATCTYVTKYTDDRFAEVNAKLTKLEETVGVASSLTDLAVSTSYKI